MYLFCSYAAVSITTCPFCPEDTYHFSPKFPLCKIIVIFIATASRDDSSIYATWALLLTWPEFPEASIREFVTHSAI